MLWTSTYTNEVLKYASLQGKWQSYLHINPSEMSKYINEHLNNGLYSFYKTPNYIFESSTFDWSIVGYLGGIICYIALSAI